MRRDVESLLSESNAGRVIRDSLTLRCLALATGATCLLLTLSGCRVPQGIVWLPDSSGVIFSGASRLARYDLSKKAHKVIVANTGTDTNWPAISKDGKRLAVARIEYVFDKDSDIRTENTQVIIYDIEGSERQRSTVHKVTSKLDEKAKETRVSTVGAGLNWSGPPDKILVASASDSFIYDCLKDKWTDLDVMIFPPNNAPIRPDGKGFLGTTKNGFAFVDWDGWVAEISDMPDKEKFDPQGFEWDNAVARFCREDKVFDFDTESLKCSVISQSPHVLHVLPSDGEVWWVHRFSEKKTQLCVFTKKEGEGSKEQQLYRMEVQIPSAKKRRVVFNWNEYDFDVPLFFPSPDGKKVAHVLKKNNAEGKAEVLVVIDNAGTLLAEFP